MNSIPPSNLDAATIALPDIFLPDRAIAIGFSGGLDSTVLLHLLAESDNARARGLRAIHVHHGLHADADAWVVHCQDQCDCLDVPLTVVRITVADDGDRGPEAAAREARHAAFAEALQTDEALALAQHRDDQAETFLLRALRASGPDGLGAIRRWRRFAPGWLWRPLLDVPRTQLLAYAQHHDLQWIEDSSNQDTSLDRNYLRHRVLPLLRERWPHAGAAFARSAALCAEASGLLADQDAEALVAVRSEDPAALDVPALRALPPARRARVLRLWIDAAGLPPLPAAGLAQIESDLLPASTDTCAEFAWGDAVIHRWRERLHGGRRLASLPTDWQVAWDGSIDLSLPNGGRLSLQGASAFDTPLRVHARQGGERITLPGRTHTHALKHVLQERDVPPWLRTAMPLVSVGQTLLAAGDVVYSAGFATWLGEHAARLTWTWRL